MWTKGMALPRLLIRAHAGGEMTCLYRRGRQEERYSYAGTCHHDTNGDPPPVKQLRHSGGEKAEIGVFLSVFPSCCSVAPIDPYQNIPATWVRFDVTVDLGRKKILVPLVRGARAARRRGDEWRHSAFEAGSFISSTSGFSG